MPDDAMIKIQGSTVGKAPVQRACEIRIRAAELGSVGAYSRSRVPLSIPHAMRGR
jgi:hypothetical protein